MEAANSDSEYRSVLLTLARTGMRPGEAIALKWSDLDFTNREILVERTLSAGMIGTTKTGKSRRIDMSLELRSSLSRLYVEREKELFGWKVAGIAEWVFVNREGNPSRSDGISERRHRSWHRYRSRRY